MADAQNVTLANIEHGNELQILASLEATEERITSTSFNSGHEDMLLYTTNNGMINILDLRESSSFHRKASHSLHLQTKDTVQSPFSKQLNVVSQA